MVPSGLKFGSANIAKLLEICGARGRRAGTDKPLEEAYDHYTGISRLA